MADEAKSAGSEPSRIDSALNVDREFPEGLSRKPLIQGAGYYVIGGPSPYEIEFQRPRQDLLGRKRPNETLLEALRRQPLTRDELSYVARYGARSEAATRRSKEKRGRALGGLMRVVLGRKEPRGVTGADTTQGATASVERLTESPD